MNFITIVAFAIGVTIGGISCAIGAQREWRKIRNKVQTSYDIRDRLSATYSESSRLVLNDLETGNFERAKEILSSHIAIAYHTVLNSSQNSGILAKERREIERQAKSSTILAAALVKKSEENPFLA